MTPRLLSLIVACALVALASTARADERDEPARCLSAYGTTACGFHCVSAYGEVRCARTATGACLAAYGQVTCWDPPRSARRLRAAGRCLAAYGTIACGYGCAAAYGEVRCAQTPQGTCSASYGQLTCWDPPARERRRRSD
jgi:hypothetical protein